MGITGVASGNLDKLNKREATKAINDENARIAELIGINAAARTTCIKPSGTSSLVVGSSSGIHAWHDAYYLRRIRLKKFEPLYQYLHLMHPELVEDDVLNPYSSAVVAVPIKAPEGAVLRTKETSLELLERIKTYNQEWISGGYQSGINQNNISATISVKDEEWDEVKNWMWTNREIYSGIAILPYDNHTYAQLPFESITEEEYNKRIVHLKGVDLTRVIEDSDLTNFGGEMACSADGCEVK